MKRYKVLDGKEIRVRDGAMVTARAVGTLASHVEFEAEVYAETNPEDTWVKITGGNYAGKFGAIRYKNEVFADVVDETAPTPEPPSVDVPPFAFHLNYHSGEWTVWFNGKEYVPKESA